MRLNPSVLAAGLVATTSRAQTACNGNAALCDRKFSNISLVGDHDSAFVGTFVTDNQGESVTDQLNKGVRFLQAQAHSWLGGINLCHTSCLEEDSGTLLTYLTTIREWMDSNPNEVLTLLLTNGDAVPVDQWGSVYDSADLTKYTYSPNKTLTRDEWPTLSQLISANTRLITFMDYHADTSNISYILDEFTYYFETPYDTTDPTFPECTIDRPPNSSPDGKMYIVNHFLDLDVFGTGITIPDYAEETTTNSVQSIGNQSALCEGLYGRPPNVVLVDYSNFGEWKEAQDGLNGL